MLFGRFPYWTTRGLNPLAWRTAVEEAGDVANRLPELPISSSSGEEQPPNASSTAPLLASLAREITGGLLQRDPARRWSVHQVIRRLEQFPRLL